MSWGLAIQESLLQDEYNQNTLCEIFEELINHYFKRVKDDIVILKHVKKTHIIKISTMYSC